MGPEKRQSNEKTGQHEKPLFKGEKNLVGCESAVLLALAVETGQRGLKGGANLLFHRETHGNTTTIADKKDKNHSQQTTWAW